MLKTVGFVVRSGNGSKYLEVSASDPDAKPWFLLQEESTKETWIAKPRRKNEKEIVVTRVLTVHNPGEWFITGRTYILRQDPPVKYYLSGWVTYDDIATAMACE